MRKATLIAVVCAFVAAPALADPYYVNFVAEDGGPAGFGENTLISYYALADGSLVETFDAETDDGVPFTPIRDYDGMVQTSWMWGDGAESGENGRIVEGSASGAYAAPWSHITGAQDSTRYAAIPENKVADPPRQVGVEFGADYRYLGLHWGSMDRYDGKWEQKIDLYTGGVDGTHVATIVSPHPGDGEWTDADTNRYVNIFLKDGLTFDSAVFQSNEFAFEFDNLAVGTVPVPGAAFLGLLGLSAAGARLRRRRA
jgi:hypothetical protein